MLQHAAGRVWGKGLTLPKDKGSTALKNAHFQLTAGTHILSILLISKQYMSDMSEELPYSHACGCGRGRAQGCLCTGIQSSFAGTMPYSQPLPVEATKIVMHELRGLVCEGRSGATCVEGSQRWTAITASSTRSTTPLARTWYTTCCPRSRITTLTRPQQQLSPWWGPTTGAPPPGLSGVKCYILNLISQIVHHKFGTEIAAFRPI